MQPASEAEEAVIAESISEVVVRRKGPRMLKGRPINPDEGDRIMLKLRPTAQNQELWKHVGYLI